MYDERLDLTNLNDSIRLMENYMGSKSTLLGRRSYTTAGGLVVGDVYSFGERDALCLLHKVDGRYKFTTMTCEAMLLHTSPV